MKYNTMKNITLKVSDEVAEAIKKMDDSRKKELLNSIENWVFPKRSLEQVMKDMSDEAKRRGLTQEVLDDLLKDE